jgi:hypothetical protein
MSLQTNDSCGADKVLSEFLSLIEEHLYDFIATLVRIDCNDSFCGGFLARINQ